MDGEREGAGGFPERLVEGYRGFVGGRLRRERDRYEAVAEQQAPHTLVIGCCDSRVAPEVIFDAGPGELFVVRLVANLVPAYSPGVDDGIGAALEFAVLGLRVPHVLVLGHARCGGVAAFANARRAPLTGDDLVGRWIAHVAPALDRAGPPGPDPAYLRRLELASVEQGLEALMTYPFVRAEVGAGRLALHGAHFDIATGELLARDPASGRFAPAAEVLPGQVSLLSCD